MHSIILLNFCCPRNSHESTYVILQNATITGVLKVYIMILMTRYCHVTATKPCDPESPQKIFFLRCQLQNLCKYNYLFLPSNGHETFNLPKRVLLHDSTTWLPRNYHKKYLPKILFTLWFSWNVTATQQPQNYVIHQNATSLCSRYGFEEMLLPRNQGVEPFQITIRVQV